MTFSPTGRTLAFALGHIVYLLDLRTARFATATLGRFDEARFLGFSRDGEILLGGTTEKKIILWRVSDARLIDTLDAGGIVTDAAFLPGNRRVLIGLWDGKIAIWDLARRMRLRRVQAHNFGEIRIDVSADGTRAVTGGDDQTVRLWDSRNLRQIKLFADGRYGIKANQSMIRGVAFVADASRILAASWMRYCMSARPALQLFDVASARQIRRLLDRNGCGVRSLSVTPDGRYALYIDRNREREAFVVLDIGAWKVGPVLDRSGGRPTTGALSPDGRIAATAYSVVNNRVMAIDFWNVAKGVRIAELTPRVERPWKITFSGGRSETLDIRTAAGAPSLARVLVPLLPPRTKK